MSGARADGPVLLCYDGSPSSASAIAGAGRLLAARNALVCHTWVGLSTAMLHTNPADLPQGLREPAEELDEADREAAERVAAEGAQLAREAGFNAQPLSVREERKTWRALLAEADRHEVSALVVGAHGLSGIGRTLLGSVSTALVHHSERPVLVVPAAAMDQGHDGPLLLCYDGSDPAKQAIETAGRLCAERNAVVLHFWQSRVAEAPGLAGSASRYKAWRRSSTRSRPSSPPNAPRPALSWPNGPALRPKGSPCAPPDPRGWRCSMRPLNTLVPAWSSAHAG